MPAATVEGLREELRITHEKLHAVERMWQRDALPAATTPEGSRGGTCCCSGADTSRCPIHQTLPIPGVNAPHFVTGLSIAPAVPAPADAKPVDDPNAWEWRQVATRLGEELASVGPDGYYSFNPAQWFQWAQSRMVEIRKHEMPIASAPAEAKEPSTLEHWLDGLEKGHYGGLAGHGMSDDWKVGYGLAIRHFREALRLYLWDPDALNLTPMKEKP